jgi:beta-galactosidase GanA
MHGSVISSAARPLHMFKEVRQLSEEFKKAADFINNTKVITKAAMHFTSLSWNMFETQQVVGGLNYQDSVFKYFYKPITEDGLRLDMIGSAHELDNYKVIFSPLLITLEENNLNKRIEKWVRDGGIWIAGPLTDIRDSVGAKYKDSPFGMLEGLCNILCQYQIPDKQQRITARWSDGTAFRGDLWYDVFDTDNKSSESIIDITDGYSTLKDKSIAAVTDLGKGKIIILGTFPSYSDMKKLLKYIYSVSNIKNYEITGDVAVIPREGSDENGVRKGIIICEYSGKKGSVVLEKPMLDLLSERMVTDVVNIEPYGVMVLKEI